MATRHILAAYAAILIGTGMARAGLQNDCK
jgi:hypothetical protein